MHKPPLFGRKPTMGRIELNVGYFPGNIPYAKVGGGRRNVLYLSGGPGNDPPHHMEVSMCLGGLKSVTDEYTFWITSRKNGQPKNYGTREMAADTAAAIKQVFPGGIEAAMGMSYGGLIAQYLAADYCGLVPKYVFVVTAYRCSPAVAQADLRFAQYLAAGRNGRAFYEVGGYLFSAGLKRSLMRGLMFLVGASTRSKHHSDYKTDVINEARA
jgi:pimeloyl-ACP methyl ester carboxylesterase